MSDPSVRYEVTDAGVAVITLDRPEKRNAFHDAQWLAFHRDALTAALDDPAVAVALVTGAGGHFSAGQDLSVFLEAGDDAERPADAPTSVADTPFAAVMDMLAVFDKPLVAAATGVAIGIGATFLLHCDVVHVGRGLRLRFPFVNLGLVPEAASSYLLAEVVGPQRAAELLFTARWVDGATAVELGLATAVVDDDAVVASAMAVAEEMAQWPVAGLRATKATMLAQRAEPVALARRVEDAGMMERAGSEENIEAVMAFLERREPDFARFRTGR